MPLSDSEIIRRIEEEGMIKNAVLENVGVDVLSYGVSSSGYDFRLDYTIKVMTSADYFPMANIDPMWNRMPSKDEIPGHFINPKNGDPDHFETFDVPVGHAFILAPYEYFLGNTIEEIDMPKDLVVNFLGKSTFARAGLIVNFTSGKWGWRGWLTVEGFNASPRGLAIFPGEGICQGQFHEVKGKVLLPYSKRDGKYHNQAKTPTLAKTMRGKVK